MEVNQQRLQRGVGSNVLRERAWFLCENCGQLIIGFKQGGGTPARRMAGVCPRCLRPRMFARADAVSDAVEEMMAEVIQEKKR